MATFLNLTPHAIVLPDRTIAPSGALARCSEVSESVGTSDGVEIIRKTFGTVIGLPEAQPDTWLIVSMLTRAACPNRTDLLSPGDLVRDANGNIIGCKNLVCN